MKAARMVGLILIFFLHMFQSGCFKQDLPPVQVYKSLYIENMDYDYNTYTSSQDYDPGEQPVRKSVKISKDISPEKIVFITIDDGPSDITNGFLDTLKANDVCATFCILGNKVRYYSETVKRMYAEGHSIVNHSYNHDYRYIYSSPGVLLSSIERTNAEIDSVIHRTEMEESFFRFPGGAGTIFTRGAGRVLARALSSKGYNTMEWNVSTEDSTPGRITAESIRNNGINDKGKDVIVVLMHDTNYRASTLEALPHIIKYYKDKGYIFRTIRDMGKGDLKRLLDKGIVNVLY